MIYNFLFKYRKYFIIEPLIAYWIAIFILTSLPSSVFSINLSITDKVQHLLAYSVLGIFVSFTLHFQTKFQKLKQYMVISAIIIVSTYGFIDELHQLFIPGRSFELLDWIADTIGGIAGSLLVWLLILLIKPKKETLSATE